MRDPHHREPFIYRRFMVEDRIRTGEPRMYGLRRGEGLSRSRLVAEAIPQPRFATRAIFRAIRPTTGM